ncbi:MAG: CoA-binding protein [Candidatus Poseidonia sp.]|nr:CoA-binding protein [Poseidonia sp.]MBL6807209.1 CoA-binding protein [Poseidonia sp.]
MLRDSHPDILNTVVQAQSIHILGSGMNSERPAHQAILDLNNAGWRLVPVHPRDAGGSIAGRAIRASIEDGIVPEIVVFFLAPERAKQAVQKLLFRFDRETMPLLWFQPGSEHEDVLEMLNEAGFPHIVDDCIVRFVKRHHLSASTPVTVDPWYRQIASEEGDGCSVWTVHRSDEAIHPPTTSLEWCGDLDDLRASQHTVARYIRSLVRVDETLEEAAVRLTLSQAQG